MVRTNTGNILAEIVAARRLRLQSAKEATPLAVLERRVAAAPPPRDFPAALKSQRSGANIIAECKKASPSEGLLRAEFNPAALARDLEAAGACALSVLTEPDSFQGSLEYLSEARAAANLPVLCKDFIFDPYQLTEARVAGADAFLLIVAILTPDLLRELIARGAELGMAALVEVHTAAEIDVALEAGANIIGVNNRDLASMQVRLDTSLELIEYIPESCVKVAESGLRTAQDIQRLRAVGFNAFLMGTTLMRAEDPGAALRDLMKE